MYCHRCKKQVILKNKEYLFCEKCLKQEIFNALFIPLQKEEDPNKYLFDEHHLDKLIKIYNINFNNTLDKNKIIERIKKGECIFKEDCSKEKRDELPCHCYLCFHLIGLFKENTFKLRFICKCKTVYKRHYMIKLGTLLLAKYPEISSKISEYFQKRAIYNCCICGNKLDKKNNNIKKTICYSPNNEKNIDSFLSTFYHHICCDCMNKNIPNYFDCKICLMHHKFSKD